MAFGLRLTFVAAQLGRAPGLMAVYGVRVVCRGVLVGAPVAQAECLAALLFVALVAFSFHVLSVLDQRVTIGAVDGVAVLFLVWCAERCPHRFKIS